MEKDLQYYKFSAYGFLKNLRFFDPFLILFFLEKGLSYTQIGMLYMLREIITNILEIPSGLVADAVGRRTSMILSFISYILSFIAFFLFSDFLLFTVAMILFSFGEAFRTGTHKAMIFEYLRIKGWEKDKSKYYGHTRSWSGIGSALSALLAGLLVLWQGSYKTVFLFSTIPYLLDLVLMLTYPRSLDGERKPGLGWSNFAGHFASIGKDFIRSLREPGTLLILADSSIYSGFLKGVKDFLQPMLQALALTAPVLLVLDDSSRVAVFIGIWYSGIYILNAMGSRHSGSLAQKIGAKRMLHLCVLSGAAFGLLSGGLELKGWFALAAVMFSLLYVIENVRKPAAISMVSDSVSRDVQASVLSVESQVKTLFAAGFSLLMGILSDRLGLAWGLMICCAALLFFWLLLLSIQRLIRKK